MTTRQIVLQVPEKVLFAEKADEVTFARELRILALLPGPLRAHRRRRVTMISESHADSGRRDLDRGQEVCA